MLFIRLRDKYAQTSILDVNVFQSLVKSLSHFIVIVAQKVQLADYVGRSQL